MDCAVYVCVGWTSETPAAKDQILVPLANFSSQDLSMGTSANIRENACSVFETRVLAVIPFPIHWSRSGLEALKQL
jgi:hypothetical protein